MNHLNTDSGYFAEFSIRASSSQVYEVTEDPVYEPQNESRLESPASIK